VSSPREAKHKANDDEQKSNKPRRYRD